MAILVVASVASADPDRRCLVASGGAAAKCVQRYAAALSACRNAADAGCEAALRSDGGALAGLLAATEGPVRGKCTAEAADKLTFLLGLDDLVLRTAEACQMWGDDLIAVIYAGDLAGQPPEVLECQRVVGARLARLHTKVVRAYGQRCYVAEFNGSPCDRARRDRVLARVRAAAGARIAHVCGPEFDALGLVPLTASPTLAGRIDALMDVVVDHARHLAQRVYPPFNLGPTAVFGPSPVGVRTLDLIDASRPNPVGPGPRPLTTDVYYPSTPEAVAGVPRDPQQVLVPAPTYRDVARAPGTFPLIVYSHGGGGIRFESAFKLAHLASHGFVVVSADHPGSNAVNTDDPAAFENRPLDVRFLIDQALAFSAEAGNVLEGAIDPLRIGGSGWSFGGYAVTTLATGPFFRGTFTDPRLKAILPLDGAVGALHWGTDAPAIFGTIAIPTLSLGGDNLFSVVLAPDHQAMFDALQPGPSIIGYGVLHGAGHSTFPDECEVPDALLGTVLNGGTALECFPALEPSAIPARYARHIINYLALNFFDGVLNGNPEALARLDPAVLAGIEELIYQSK